VSLADWRSVPHDMFIKNVRLCTANGSKNCPHSTNYLPMPAWQGLKISKLPLGGMNALTTKKSYAPTNSRPDQPLVYADSGTTTPLQLHVLPAW